MKCDVCGRDRITFELRSKLIRYFFNYCQECIDKKAEPIGAWNEYIDLNKKPSELMKLNTRSFKANKYITWDTGIKEHTDCELGPINF